MREACSTACPRPAFAICNIMSSHVDKGIFEELVKNRTISDIVVVTLLRINSGFTKEALAKALFNFLSRGEFREVMVGQGGKDDLDLLAAMPSRRTSIKAQEAMWEVPRGGHHC